MINLSPLLRLFNQIDPLSHLYDSLANKELLTHPLGVPIAARPAFIAALQQHLQVPILFITARADRSRQLGEQIRHWAENPEFVFHLPNPGALPYERVPWNKETIAARLAALTGLVQAETIGVNPLVVTSARALMQKTAPVAWFKERQYIYRLNQRINMTDTLEMWLSLGYQRRDLVEKPGEFSHRGGIMDVFPPSYAYPVRMELFGDELDSLRFFDPISQRSEAKLDDFWLGPATEAFPLYLDEAADTLDSLDKSSLQPMATLEFQEEMVTLETGATFRGIENYLPLMQAELTDLLTYLPPNSMIIIENPAELQAIALDLEEQAQNLKVDMIEQHILPPDWPQPYFTWSHLEPRLKTRQPLILGFEDWEGTPPPSPSDTLPAFRSVFGSPRAFGGQIKPALSDIVQRKETNERVVIVSRQASRLQTLLADQDIIAKPVYQIDYPPPPGSLTLIEGLLQEGWLLRPREGAAPTLTILTDVEIFGVRKEQARPRFRKRRRISPDAFFADINPGDYVVHIEHGVGVFKGLIKLDFDGVAREYLEVHYRQADKLYVPIHQADRLARYVGLEDATPNLNRLGTPEWTKIKKRARRGAIDIAKELVRIYTAREVLPGRAFSPDNEWQHELEAAFPYVETDDQYQAIVDVKRDMEDTRPMDRLICGDVGYGKTEVALRAAFKAVMDGVQVAILVPTTVLAQQHYNTFRERLEPFPVKVEMLSRFRTKKQAQEIVEGLVSGGVDIVIGTHRLLQKNVKFKELGLLVIDEEQRFGVVHKEKLKEIRTHVDTLTLSATPIPRTLHMALSGVRYMSLIETPPEERLPIKTTVTHTDDTLIRTAILREIDRGGQVYFVHNRVMGIEQMANHIHKLVPEVRIEVGHGQMSERKLERIMLAFARNEFDVLVSTTIIESGLDIPNVNTIIINRADKLGLAQLYQLRGRVGRAAVQSYAYLLTPKNYNLSDVARKRLEAIQEATELGAGFRIAMRDLEIRGAGDLLGAKQHGHISAVGFDLYVRLLAQAMQELKGEGEAKDALTASYLSPLEDDIQINLPLPVYFPPHYLSEEYLRLKLYRRMANLTTLEEVETMGQELEDRFGKLPEPVLNLLYQLKLKVLCRAAAVKILNTENNRLVIKSEALEYIDRQGLQRRLPMGSQVDRRQLAIPVHQDPIIWQTDLEKALIAMGRLVNDPGA